jgi:hypothetical protein
MVEDVTGTMLLTTVQQCGEQAGLSLLKHLNCRIVRPTKNIVFSVDFSRNLRCFFESINIWTLGVLCYNNLNIRYMLDIYYLTLQC